MVKILAFGCLVLNIMELGGAQLVVHLKKTQQKCLCPEIMTLFLKIIHRPCCEQLRVRTTFCLQDYTCQPYHYAEGERRRI